MAKVGATRQQQITCKPSNTEYRKKTKGHCSPLVPVNIPDDVKLLKVTLEYVVKNSKDIDLKIQAKKRLRALNFSLEKSMDWKTAKYISNGDISEVFKGMKCVPDKKKNILVLNQKELDFEKLVQEISRLEDKVATSLVKVRVIEAKKKLKELYKVYENWSA